MMSMEIKGAADTLIKISRPQNTTDGAICAKGYFHLGSTSAVQPIERHADSPKLFVATADEEDHPIFSSHSKAWP